MKNALLALCCLCVSCGLHAQEIRIRVVDAKYLKPIKGDCLWIALGGWRTLDDMSGKNPSQIFAPLDTHGAVTLEIDTANATAHVAGEPPSCQPDSTTGPVPLLDGRRMLAATTGNNRDCQTRVGFLPPPAFPIDDILRTGRVAANGCTRARPKAVPGELVIVARAFTAKEKREMVLCGFLSKRNRTGGTRAD